MTTSITSSQRPRQVFLSYASGDQAVARRVADALLGAGLTVWFAAWELTPGESIASRVAEGMSASDIIIVLLSPRSVASRWVAFELETAIAREIHDRAITVIPAVIADCEIPPLLAEKVYLDLRTDLDAGIQQLIRRLAAVPEIDYSRLDGRTFENLVADLLGDIGFTVERPPYEAERGVDLVASRTSRDETGGEERDTWLVEVKFYRDQRVSVSALRQMMGYLLTSQVARKGLIVTNGQLTSVAREYLADAQSRAGREVRVLDGTELTNLLSGKPRLIERYFAARG